MRLVLFTSHYPFHGEAFLEDEIRIAENYFDSILIVTLEKNADKAIYYIPSNAKVITVRDGASRFSGIGKAIFNAFFLHHGFAELRTAVKERGWSGILPAARAVIADERAINYLNKAEDQWLGNTEETIFYSYWLSAEATYLVRRKKQLRGICIARVHGGDCFFNRAYHPYRREQLQKLDGIFPISMAGREDLLTHYGMDCEGLKEKTKVARLGIEIRGEMSSPWKKQAQKTIVTCSNVIPLKRLDLMIDALSGINGAEIRWIHFGDGSEMDAIQRRAQEKLSNKSNISFRFMGLTPKKEILAFYGEESVDLFVNCSDAEGIPVSMMEAMAYGIPAIGRNVGGVSELLDKDCGILLPDTVSPEQLAEAIENMLSTDEDRFSGIRKRAGEKVRSLYSMEDNYTMFFDTLIGMKS